MCRILIFLASLQFITIAQAQFKNESQVSLIKSSGNADLETYNAESKSSYTFDKNTISANGEYTYGEADEIRSAESWEIQSRYDRKLIEEISLFIAQSAAANRFAGIQRQYNTDVGGKYTFYKSEVNTSLVEAGYRFTKEHKVIKIGKETEDSKARLYTETEHKFSSHFSAKAWFEYLPNFSESDDYQYSYEPSIIATLNSNFALKVAHKWEYDNQPAPGGQRRDKLFTTSLVANF